MKLNVAKMILPILFLCSVFPVLAQSQINFNAETLDGNKVELSKIYAEGPTLVNFWALWCKPCRAEMRHLENIYLKYSEKGFSIIGVNQDSPRSVAKVRAFVSSHNLTFPIVIDPNQEIFQQFNGQSIPLSVLYNKKGEAIYTHVGYLPGDEFEMESEIKKALGLDD